MDAVSDEKAGYSSCRWGTTVEPITYGGSDDLWSTTWTPADINDSRFGLKFQAQLWGTQSRTAYVDCVYISVDYSTGTTYEEVATGGGGAAGDAVSGIITPTTSLSATVALQPALQHTIAIDTALQHTQ
ncbi:MAG: hypothetical protein R3C17_10645 [Planctomycetaceae bacterium]